MVRGWPPAFSSSSWPIRRPVKFPLITTKSAADGQVVVEVTVSK